MLNQCTIIGRVLEIKENSIIIKNQYNNNTNNEIECVSYGKSLMENVKEYVKINDIVGIKGHLEDNNVVMIEKLSLLSNNS
jgi:single-stranded DNA-binding protein